MQGEILPWRDVLHEGPVDASLPLQKLSERRAAFIAEAGWASAVEAGKSFEQRDARLARSGGDDEVVLWFEHDLYDQLQLIQLLDWFAAHPHPKLSLVCEAEYLGEMKPERAARLFEKRSRITPEQLAAGRAAWEIFGSDQPDRLQNLSTKSLPFLGAALKRHLEEFPWGDDGLSRTERQILEVLDRGPAPFEKVFRETQKSEEPRFMGDVVLKWHLARLKAVQEGGDHQPRWLGGILVDDECPWRWDPDAGKLVS
jgi:hypothetical protein